MDPADRFGNWESPQHCFETGLLHGYLRKKDIEVTNYTDASGDYTDTMTLVLGEYGELEVTIKVLPPA